MKYANEKLYLTTKREYKIMCQQCRVDWLRKVFEIPIFEPLEVVRKPQKEF